MLAGTPENTTMAWETGQLRVRADKKATVFLLADLCLHHTQSPLQIIVTC